MTLCPVAVLIVLSLVSGCAVEKTISTEVPKRLSLTWDRSDWRICDQRECPAPTSKTVLLVAAPPTVEPVVREPTKPIQVARKLAPISVTFQFASATLSDLDEMEIKKAVALIEPGDSILVEGRTDDLGSQAFNNRLARKRAEVVAAYLKGLGVKSPIDIRSQGKCCYAIANNSDESRAINRRVDLHFSSTQKE
ncbi:MAG: OmpA family protein [Rhodocyclales bacterium]|nr:OmpA family protein [Rhodocyclales bacterium]